MPMTEHWLDIVQQKRRMRQHLSAVRKGIPEAERIAKDMAIFKRLCACEEYRNCESLFCYVSVADEVDTRRLLAETLQSGKRVAVPRCSRNPQDGSPRMDFYWIGALDDLKPGAFGLLEPSPERCERAYATETSLCIVPGLGYDRSGYRMGYGRGYYDRFLSDYPGCSIGLCYEDCLQRQPLPRDQYDLPVDKIVTDRDSYPMLLKGV